MTNQEKFEEVFGQSIHGAYDLDIGMKAFTIDKIGSCSRKETYNDWLKAEYEDPKERLAKSSVKKAIKDMIEELEKAYKMLEG